jgi:hypothetical protein
MTQHHTAADSAPPAGVGSPTARAAPDIPAAAAAADAAAEGQQDVLAGSIETAETGGGCILAHSMGERLAFLRMPTMDPAATAAVKHIGCLSATHVAHLICGANRVVWQHVVRICQCMLGAPSNEWLPPVGRCCAGLGKSFQTVALLWMAFQHRQALG